MNGITWQEPPAPDAKTTPVWASIAAELHANPGRWALVSEGKRSRTVADYISRKHGLETQCRRQDDGTFNVWARSPKAAS